MFKKKKIKAKALYFKMNSNKVLHNFSYNFIRLVFLIILKIYSNYPGASI